MNISNSHNRRYGFTLIELLVVIAIIALLAAILFPVFGRARENARRSTCQSNLKQIGLGMLQYTQDYDEYQAKSYYGTLGPSFKNTDNYKWMDAIYPYVKSEQIFSCPSDKTTKTTPYVYFQNSKAIDGSSYGWGSYVMNNAYYNPGTDATHGPSNRKLSEVAAPSTTFWIVEQHVPEVNSNVEISWGYYGHTPANGGTIVTYQQSGNGQNYLKTQAASIAERHLETSNFLYCDGHVKAMKLSTATAEKQVALKSGNRYVMPFFTIEDD